MGRGGEKSPGIEETFVSLCFIYFCFQFDCRNTLPDQLLEEVYVEVTPQEADTWIVVKSLPCAQLHCGQPGTVFCLLEMPEDISNGKCLFLFCSVFFNFKVFFFLLKIGEFC